MLELPQLVSIGAPHLPAGLLSDQVRRRLRRVPTALPAMFTMGTFECRLDDDDRVDFQACAPRSEGAHAAVRDWLGRLDGMGGLSRGHQATASLLRAWVDRSSSLGSDVVAIWVEVDVDDTDADPWPFPFFTLTPPWVRPAPRPPQRTAALVDAGLQLLTHGDLEPRTHTMVHECLRALPPQASLLHVAMRPMPGGDVVRLIAATPWELVPGLLKRLDWPEPADGVRHFLERYCQDTLINSIQLDIGHRLGPRIGLELYFPTSPLSDPRWQRLFDLLVADGACTAARRDDVCAWPMRHGASHGGVLRELLVKVVYEIDRPLRAKAYLPFAPAPFVR